MPLQFDSSPYLQVWQAQRQRDQEEAQRPQVANQNILQALQMLAESKRQQQLMDIQKQTLANTQGQQALENRYKYGEPIDPGIQVGVPRGTGQSRLFGGLPKGVEGPQVPMQVGQNSSLIDQFNKFRSGGMKSSDARPEFMDALGQDERKQFYENANPKLTGPKSIDGILAQKVSNGEMTLEDAVKMKQQNSGGSFMMGGVTGQGNPVFYNTKNPNDVITGEVPGGGILYPKTPSQDQSNAGIYGQRAQEANQQLNGLLEKGFDAASLMTQAQGALPNFAQPEDVQAYEQLKRNFINATLRRESGATIRSEEMAEGNRQYFPQGGDKPETLKQKELNRQTVIQSLGRIAGPMGNQNRGGGGNDLQSAAAAELARRRGGR